MKWAFIICGAISALTALVAILSYLRLSRGEARTKRLFSPIQTGTLVVFLYVVAIYIPIYYFNAGGVLDFGEGHVILRPLLISVHNALRTFILDGEFNIITDGLAGMPKLLRLLYGGWAALLYVAAPLLIFGNVVSMLGNLWDALKYTFSLRRCFYIMSALNRRSLALGKNIRESNRASRRAASAAGQRRPPLAVIVYTEINGDGVTDELLEEARNIGAICLRRDIRHLNVLSRRRHIDIFLISEDQAENVNQAMVISHELSKQRGRSAKKGKKAASADRISVADERVKIFVFNSTVGAARMIDSVKSGELTGEPFMIRRVDEYRRFVWKTLPEMKLFRLIEEKYDSPSGRRLQLSVLLVGMGNYGMEFFKALVWYCQLDGLELRLTLIDSAPEGEGDLRSRLNRECPELLATNRAGAGDAYYDIEIMSGVDMTRDAFDLKLLASVFDRGLSRRLAETDLAIVDLGDDDLNIDVSVHLRELFDRAQLKEGASADRVRMSPAVYTIVEDERRGRIDVHNDGLADENVGEGSLLHFKNKSYGIHFIGGITERYDYDMIYDRRLDGDAYRVHTDWLRQERGILETLAAKKNRSPEEETQLKKISDDFERAAELYSRFEYYRDSSESRVLRLREKGGSYTSLAKKLWPEAEERRLHLGISEHMRWNSYMRSEGFVYHPVRFDRAKTHNLIVPWDSLTLEQQEMDMTKEEENGGELS